MQQQIFYGVSAALVGAIVVMQPRIAVAQFNEQEQKIAAIGKAITVIINSQNPGNVATIAKQGNTYSENVSKYC